jgi:hypothetical protein
MRVQWSADTTVFDLSDSVFMISAAPTLTLSEPQSYDTLTPGELISVAWNSSGLVTTVNILLRRGSVIAETLFAATENDGSESWVVTDPAADSVILRIESTSNPLSVFSEATGLSIHDTVFVGPLAAPEVVLLGGLNFVTIAWLPVPNAAAYRLEQSLDFMNWDSLTTATDTLIVVPVDSLAPILQYFRVIGVR